MEQNGSEHGRELRRVVCVLQDVTSRESFDTLADVAEALKVRCAQLRIRYDAGLVSAAIHRLEEGGRRPLVAGARRRLVEREPDRSRELDRHQAAAAIRMIEDRLKVRLR